MKFNLRRSAILSAILIAGCGSDDPQPNNPECTATDLSSCASGQVCSSEGTCITPQKPVPEVGCGNGVVDGNDWCDGNDLNGRSCTDFKGFIGGTLKCDSTCQFNTDDCTECNSSTECQNRTDSRTICKNNRCVLPDFCGDGVKNNDEECDGEDGIITCEDIGYAGGEISCNHGCMLNDSKCVQCTPDNMENCEDGQICNEHGNCVDPEHVVTCGDGMVEANEECDDKNLNGKTCADFGDFSAGTLKCNSRCTFDLADCLECETNTQCAANYNDKTICQNHHCVAPEITETPECDANHHCASDEYCHIAENNPLLNKCEKQPVCSKNGCIDDKTLCHGADWDKPGASTSCPNGCSGSACSDVVCAKGMCQGNAYCNTSKSAKGEWTNCGTDETCEFGSCIAKPSDGTKSIVISQAYPGGAGTDSIYDVKYIELFNTSDQDALLQNWSIQYAAAGAAETTIPSICPLPDRLPFPRIPITSSH